MFNILHIKSLLRVLSVLLCLACACTWANNTLVRMSEYKAIHDDELMSGSPLRVKLFLKKPQNSEL